MSDKAMNTEPVVLYVEDNPNSRTLLAGILEESGFDVITVNDPLEALELCKKLPFDVALLDYQMPVMSGVQLGREIKVLAPDVPVAILSGRSTLPVVDSTFVDAHFGSETSLDDLLYTLKMLVYAKLHTVATPGSRTSWSNST